jgi:hypothetical protein
MARPRPRKVRDVTPRTLRSRRRAESKKVAGGGSGRFIRCARAA